MTARNRLGFWRPALVAVAAVAALVTTAPGMSAAASADPGAISPQTSTGQLLVSSDGAALQELLGGDIQNGDDYGYAVDISKSWAAVGAPGSPGGNEYGAVYIFKRTPSGTWTQTQQLTADDGGSGDAYGLSVSISGTYLAVGAAFKGGGQGAVYLYHQEAGSWNFQTELQENIADTFGEAVDMFKRYLAVGAPNFGNVFVYHRIGASDWSQPPVVLTPPPGAESQNYGQSVSIWSTSLAVGSAEQDSWTGVVYTYHRLPGSDTWDQLGNPLSASGIDGGPGDGFGSSVARWHSDLVVGAPGHDQDVGEAYVFRHTLAGWSAPDILKPDGGDESEFGSAVAICCVDPAVGRGTILVGAPQADAGAGAVYEFSPSLQKHTLETEVSPGPGSNYGSSVALGPGGVYGGPTALVGAYNAEHYRGDAFVSQPLVHDQLGENTGVGIVSQDFESGYDDLDSVGADDFLLSHTAVIRSIVAPGAYIYGSGPARNETVIFYKDHRGLPGRVLTTETVAGEDDGTGNLSLDLPSPVTLKRGSYWLSIVANMDYSTGGEWGWDTTSSQWQLPAVWENPGGGWDTGCSTWEPLDTCVGDLGQGPDFAFALYD